MICSAGYISTNLRFSTERWLSVSKVLIESTSLPKNSILYGYSASGVNTSTMPPRMLYPPLASTISIRS